MRIPSSQTQQSADVQATAPAGAYSAFESDEEFALGWECANPALQIDRWKEETAVESLRAAC